jgi:hypothetical protein
MARRLARYAVPVTVALLALLLVSALQPVPVQAASLQLPLPGWLQDMLDQLEIALVKTLQDTARVGGVLLWGVLKVCGLVGLFGDGFSELFGTVVTEALNAVITGSVHDLIRGSLMVSLGLFGLSLLARPFWPDLKLVSFQRAAIWGIAIQAYLLNAPGIYTELETWRVDLSEQVASAVSTGAIPGCPGNVVEVLLCITGTSTAEVLDPSLTALPDQIPYGGTESVQDLYNHCVYHPRFLYGDPPCNPDSPVGDPWEVLAYAQDALGTQLLGLILGALILAYGVLQIALGLSAGMMFVLFPVAAIFAFYLPLESFPAGVIRNYINIFLKSVVLLTLAGVVIRLFSVAAGGPSGGSLAAMAAVALVDLLLCLVMAKEALASLLSSVSFIGSSVSTLGAAFGLTGGRGGAAAAALPSPESRVAASMIGGGAVTQTLMGAPHPYGGAQGTTLLGAGGAVLSAPANTARAALQTAMAASTGGAGAVVGALAAAKDTDYGSLALMGNAATTVLGRTAGRGFVTGAGLVATRQLLTGGESGVDSAARPTGSPPPPPAQSSLLVPVSPSSSGPSPTPSAPQARPSLVPADAQTGAPATAAPLQSLLLGDQTTGLTRWSQPSAQQIQQAAAKLEPASPDVENAAFDLARAGHQQARQWEREGRSPVLPDGSLDPRFVEEVVQQEPDAAGALIAGQMAANLPPDQRLSVGEAVVLGVTTQRSIPGPQVRQGLARAIKTTGQGGDLNSALQDELGAGSEALFGPQAEQVEDLARQMQDAGLANDLGRQLVETVGENLERDPRLTAQQFRERGGHGRFARMRQWDRATGDPETTDRIVGGLIGLGAFTDASVQEIPKPPVSRAATPSVTPEAAVRTTRPTVRSTRPASPAETQYDPALFERLRSWRLAAAQQEGQKAFYVFPDATLERIAAARPQSVEELEAVKGVGPKKLEQYGQAVLDITREEGEKEA